MTRSAVESGDSLRAIRPGLPLRVLAPGLAALALTLLLTLGPLLVIGSIIGGDGNQGMGTLRRSDWRALEFTLVQALLSALFSVLLAIPLARALARQRFRGRETLTSLLGAPFLLPVIVAVLGIIVVWGRAGWVNDVLGLKGGERIDIYGLAGVLLAHVFFNLPLATRLILQGFADLPPERWRVAAQNGLEGWSLFLALEWPSIRASAPAAFALIFLLCATSFAVALMLGGGPAATTLELAIYEAAGYEFDLGRAVRLAALQFGVCSCAAIFALMIAAPMSVSAGTITLVQRWDGQTPVARIVDGGVILLACAFLGLPMLAVVARGVPGLFELGPEVWSAAGRSLIVAALAMILSLCLALGLAMLIVGWQRHGLSVRSRAADIVGLLPIAASPFIIGIAAIIVLKEFTDPFALALPLTATVNAIMAMPFALRLLIPAIHLAQREHGPLADSLGLSGLTRIRVLYWPRLKRPLGFAAGLSGALAVGDLGVIALFARPEEPTLPLLMQLLASSRQLTQANGAALVLIAMCLTVFWVCDGMGRR